jgi:outer membrane protein TolC
MGMNVVEEMRKSLDCLVKGGPVFGAGIALLAGALLFAETLLVTGIAFAQGQGGAVGASVAPTQSATGAPEAAAKAGVERLSLQDAIELARRNDPQFQSARTDAGIAREDRVQARDKLLPNVVYNNSEIYTQAVHAPVGLVGAPPVVFIANNAVHEYISQGNVHESLDVATVIGYRQASAAAAVARARAEIASRGLIVTVVQSYYGVEAAKEKLDAAARAADEGEKFLKLTQDLEHGGEVAHADEIKAELLAQDRRRQLREAQLAVINARLDFAVLVFPNLRDDFELSDDLHRNIQLPLLPEFQQQAAQNNPDVQAALATVRVSNAGVGLERAAYLPSLSMDYFYGIDATRFATKTDGVSNLGSSAVATLSIPIWNWGSTQSRVRQAELRRAQAKRELSLAQRRLLAEIQSRYAEAEAALNELEGLRRSVELAGESLRLAVLRYRNSEGTILEVSDAQTVNAQANATYQDGAVRYQVALATLQTLTGVLKTQ